MTIIVPFSNFPTFSFPVFGIGSMIYSGIEIGMFFELNMDEEADCKNLFSILRPILQMTFVFVQMYFIFLNQKVRPTKSKFRLFIAFLIRNPNFFSKNRKKGPLLSQGGCLIMALGEGDTPFAAVWLCQIIRGGAFSAGLSGITSCVCRLKRDKEDRLQNSV